MATEGNNPFLPDEIIINVLKRLPVKSIIRFQSVSKDWKGLFKTQSFIADHLHHSHPKIPFVIFFRAYPATYNPVHGAFYNPVDGSFTRPLDGYLLNHKMEIHEVYKPPPLIDFSDAGFVGSSNGLLCALVKEHALDESQYVLLLWNPATREFRYIPKNIEYFEGSEIYGFGFSPIINDYKILRLRNHRPLHNDFMLVDQVEVYSLRTESWKEVEFEPIQGVRYEYGTIALTTNGSMFWLGQVEDGRRFVVSFDIAMEVFELIPIPPSSGESRHKWLTLYENKLAMFHCRFVSEHFPTLIDLLVMEEVAGASAKSWSWTMKYTLRNPRNLYPICIWRNETRGIDIGENNDTFYLRGEQFALNRVKDDFLLQRFLSPLEFRKLPYCPYEDGDDQIVILNYAESLVSVATPTTPSMNCGPSSNTLL